jgi:hypothetical protein
MFALPSMAPMRETASSNDTSPGSCSTDIVTALRDGRRPDYSRGFSSRPQLRGSTELAGTEGWGAHCYSQRTNAADNDRSFRSWTCAEGLVCQASGNTSRMGMCFVGERQQGRTSAGR